MGGRDKNLMVSVLKIEPEQPNCSQDNSENKQGGPCWESSITICLT